MEKIIGIYKIINKVNQKVYVGSSIDIKSRIRNHKSDLRGNRHHCSHLQYAYNKYGESNFEAKVIERCDREVLLERERYWMEYLGANDKNYGYNLSVISDTTKFTYSEEHRQKLSDSWTEERKKEHSEFAKQQHLSIKYIIFNQKNIRQYKVLTREQLLRQGFTASQLSKSLRSNRLKGSFIFTKSQFTGCQLLNKVIGNLHMEYQSNKTYLFNLQGVLVKEFDSIGECAKYLKVTDTAIRKSIKLQTKLNRLYYASNTLEFEIMVKPKRSRVGGRKKRSIVGDGVVYNTVEDASKSLNVPIATVYSRLHSVSTWGYL